MMQESVASSAKQDSSVEADGEASNPHDPVALALNITDLVRSQALEAERRRYLPHTVAQALVQNNLYRLGAPTQFNGLDADAATQMRVIEVISRADGAAGWNLMIGIETFALVSPSMNTCSEMIVDPTVVMASSTAAVGKAEAIADGFTVSGQWQFVSGIHNADVFGATVQRFENGTSM